MYKSITYLSLVLLVALFVLSSCATIISGKNQDVTIRSTPAQAGIKIERVADGQMVTAWEGSTPATASLARKHAYLLTIALEGYQPVEMGLENGSNGWVWGNILLGGFIGLIVDFGNGAAKTIEPDVISVDLVAVSTSSSLGIHDTHYAVFHIKDHNGAVKSTAALLTPIEDFVSSR